MKKELSECVSLIVTNSVTLKLVVSDKNVFVFISIEALHTIFIITHDVTYSKQYMLCQNDIYLNLQHAV